MLKYYFLIYIYYFEELATPNPTHFCPKNRLAVYSRLLEIMSKGPNASTIEVHVVKAISSLTTNKLWAAGPDSLQSEHFCFGPITLITTRLAPLFQAMIHLHYVPQSFLISHIVPIPKDRHIDTKDPSKYRGSLWLLFLANFWSPS